MRSGDPVKVKRTQDAVRRLLACAISALAWLTLWKHFTEALGNFGLIHGLWFMAYKYSHWLNALIAVVFPFLAISPKGTVPPSLMGKFLILIAILWSMILITPGWAGFLQSSLKLRIEHGLVPLLVLIYWISFVPKGYLRATDPVIWTIMPIVYTAFVLIRGAWTGDYPYSVADANQVGYPRIFAYIAAITVGSLVTGYLLLFIDRAMLRLSTRIAWPGTRYSKPPSHSAD